MPNPFFKNYGPFLIKDLLNHLNIKSNKFEQNFKIDDIKDLESSKSIDITFFHSKKYQHLANKTKASFCITSETLKKELPKNCTPIIVENILVSVSKLTSIFYPDSINDDFDKTVKFIGETQYKDKVTSGKNVLIGENVSIGLNCKIGHNSIIEKKCYNWR